MTILDKIYRHKRTELVLKKKEIPVAQLITHPEINRKCYSLREALSSHGSSGIIAEFKRKSPSRGDINIKAAVEEVIRGYASAGAAACSILTDEHFFGGSLSDIATVRPLVNLPLLRKDFMIDPYQVYEAKVHGADVILLIAAILDSKEIAILTALAGELGMESLLEIHDKTELEKIVPEVTLVGINNRDLKTFTVDINRSLNLASKIPGQITKVSESGISDSLTIKTLRNAGFKGFLMGEYFMQSEDPADRCRTLINTLKT